MTFEHVCTKVVPKPWGRKDLRPWGRARDDDITIGEIWFQRADINAPAPALLIKLLFTNEPLSIQVHPDDAFAHSIGSAQGKDEAWYILSATPDAKVAVGLTRRMTAAELLVAVKNGSIVELIDWRRVLKDDVIFIPAGTIHTIGPGVVLAEIQQRTDMTFRLFDYGRQREIHVDRAVAAAHAGPLEWQYVPTRLADARTLLVSSRHFILERIDLPPQSHWALRAERETWVLVLEGDGRFGLMQVAPGEAIFIEADSTIINAGADGLSGLLAYPGSEPIPNLLQILVGK